jgi:hypothetical protein
MGFSAARLATATLSGGEWELFKVLFVTMNLQGSPNPSVWA